MEEGLTDSPDPVATAVNSTTTNTTPAPKVCCSNQINVLEASLLGLQSEVNHQKNCFDLILQSDSHESSKSSKNTDKRMSSLETMFRSLESNLLTLNSSINTQSDCMERLSHKMDLVNQKNDENAKRINDELKALRIIIKANSESLRQSELEREALKNQLNVLNKELINEKAMNVRSADDFRKRLFDQKLAFESEVKALEKNHKRELLDINRRLMNLESNSNSKSKATTTAVGSTSSRQRDIQTIIEVDDHDESYQPTFSNIVSKTTNVPKSRVPHTNGRQVNPKSAHQTSSASDLDPGSQSVSKNMQYKKMYAVILHDGTHNNFDHLNFDKQFRIHTYETNGLTSLKKDDGFSKLTNKVNPDCIYVHLGINDLLKKIDTSKISQLYYDLAVHLLENYRSNVCFSLIIPTHNNLMLRDKIKTVNNDVIEMVSHLRSTHRDFRNRLFTFDNNRIGDHSTYIQGSQQFSVRGKKMIWMRLNEGLKKTLRLPRPSYTVTNKPSRSTTQHKQATP